MGTEVVVPSNNLPTKWEDTLAKYAKEAAEQETVQGKFVSFKSGVMQYNGQPVPGNKMQIIVLDSVFEYQYYAGQYNANQVVSPTCYALGRKESELVASMESTERQAEKCDGCRWNEWESDPQGGKGKACKNIRRLAFFDAASVDKGVEAVMGAELAFARIPVTSVKNWGQYVIQIANVVKRPPFGVITEMSVVPDNKTILQVKFGFIDAIQDEALIQAIINKREALGDTIMFDYPKNTPETATPPARQPRPAAQPQGPKKF